MTETSRILESRELVKVSMSDAYKLYLFREKKYTDSWVDMTIQKMKARLTEEFAEYMSEKDYGTYAELLDIINVAAMLAAKLKAAKGISSWDVLDEMKETNFEPQ